MKNLSLLLLLPLCGCLQKAESLNPFYTPDLKDDLPAILGEWDEVATSHEGTEHTVDTWLFSDHLRVYTDHGPEDFDTVFFRVDNQTYCDVFNRDQQLHTLCRPAIQDRTLTLRWLDQNWLTNAIASRSVVLPPPAMQPGSSNLVFTASAEQWVSFLRQHGTNTDAFADGNTLRKSPAQNFVPRRRS
jgi:hypothetical protein